MTEIVYEAALYTHDVTYKNPRTGEVRTMELSFSLDPVALMQVISTFQPKKVKSGNPALRGQEAEIDGETQLKFLRDLVCQSAGTWSSDGEYWEAFPNFGDSVPGKAFLAKLAASDGMRRNIAEKVVMDPFKAFVQFAKADDSNTPADIEMFDRTLVQMINIFTPVEKNDETLEQKKARLAAEMAALDATPGVTPLPSDS